ncbi:MAG: anti-sigma factor family protein [Bacteroidota bacterium]
MNMKCTDIKLLLTDFATEKLSQAESDLVRSHIEACPGCRAELEEIKRIFASLSSLPPVHDPGEAYWASILPRISQAISHPAPERQPLSASYSRHLRLVPEFRFALAAAVALVVAAIAFNILIHRSRTPVRSDWARQLEATLTSLDDSTLVRIQDSLRLAPMEIPIGTQSVTSLEPIVLSGEDVQLLHQEVTDTGLLRVVITNVVEQSPPAADLTSAEIETDLGSTVVGGDLLARNVLETAQLNKQEEEQLIAELKSATAGSEK